MSRGMDDKDRVAAIDSLARYAPRAAVPILIKALNEPSEPVRRAAARGLWTVARNDNPDDAAAARAAMPALRIALGDSSVSVAMNAAGALERLGEPATVLAAYRRNALRTPGPYAYERFLAARGLIGIDPAPALMPFVLDWLFGEHKRLESSDSSGARDNIRIASAALRELVETGDRGVLVVLEGELKADRPGTADLLRAMAMAKPSPDHFARTLVIETDASNADTVAAAYDLMAKLDSPADLSAWVPAAARALADPRRQAGAARALKNVAGKTALGMPELARLAESTAPEEVRVIALAALADASDATRDWPASVLAAAKPAALQAFRTVLAREPAGPPFDVAAARSASPNAISVSPRQCIWRRSSRIPTRPRRRSFSTTLPRRTARRVPSPTSCVRMPARAIPRSARRRWPHSIRSGLRGASPASARRR